MAKLTTAEFFTFNICGREISDVTEVIISNVEHCPTFVGFDDGLLFTPNGKDGMNVYSMDAIDDYWYGGRYNPSAKGELLSEEDWDWEDLKYPLYDEYEGKTRKDLSTFVKECWSSDKVYIVLLKNGELVKANQ